MPDTRDGLNAVFAPASVLLCGASRDPGRIGGKILHRLKSSGYGGRIEVLSANESVQGVAARATLDELHPVDLAVVTLPAPATLQVIDDIAARAAARAAIVCSSGFADAGDTAAQERLVTLCRDAGMRLVGPNSLGVFSAPSRFVGMFGTQIDRPSALPLPDGDVAIASESGAVGAFVHSGLQSALIGVRHWAALGNAAMTSVGDTLRWYAGDSGVRTVLVYQEVIADPADLFDGMRACRDAGQRVVFLTSGASDAGRRAAASHTGRFVGDYRLSRALAREAGAILADSIDHMIDLAKARRLGGRPGDGWVIGTISGAAGVEAADEAARTGLALTTIPDRLRDRLRAALPAFASLDNPVDVTAQIVNEPDLIAAATKLVLDEPTASGMLWVLGLQEASGAEIARQLATVVGADGEVAVAWLSPPDAAVEVLQCSGIPVYDSIVRMVAAVGGIDGAAPGAAPSAKEVARPAVPEPQVKEWLADVGLTVPPAEPPLQGGAQAIVKAAATSALHKRRAGLMAGPVATEAERDAVRAVLERRCADLRLEGATVFSEAWEAPPVREWFLSVVASSLGPIVLLGPGGGDVEELDAVRAALPADADALVAGAGFADVERARRTLRALLDVFAARGLELLEINPLAEDGDGRLRCLDAVACLAG